MICRNTPLVLNETIMLKILIQHQYAFHQYYIYNIFFTYGGKGVSYFLVPIIYHFVVSIDVGHYNCTLFHSGCKCITFDDASVTEKLSHDVLLNVNEQKYIQILFYVRDDCPYQQSFTKDLRMPWPENEEILKTVEKIITGDINCPGSIQRGYIYDLVMGSNSTGSIISSFPNVFKVNDVILRPCVHCFLRVCSIRKELPILLNM